MSHLDDSELGCWLALIRLPGFGGQSLRALLDKGLAVPDLFQLDRGALQQLGLTQPVQQAFANVDWHLVEKDQQWLSTTNARLILYVDADYPPLLKHIASPPIGLFVLGNADLLSLPQLAVVGSRNPTYRGREHATVFAQQLIEHGLIVTSGLALGIDAAAHHSALKHQGQTIAVAGSGLDTTYPKRHRQLAQQIVEQGALVSEFPPGVKALAEHFPRRNRLISGLSLGVLVIEAALKSGSLITAHFANEQGREVFAVPGSIANPLAKGCHALIREGAKLVETAEDVLEELPIAWNANARSSQSASCNRGGLDFDTRRLLDELREDLISIDQLIVQTGLNPEQAASKLMQLEMKGYIVAQAGGYVRTNV